MMIIGIVIRGKFTFYALKRDPVSPMFYCVVAGIVAAWLWYRWTLHESLRKDYDPEGIKDGDTGIFSLTGQSYKVVYAFRQRALALRTGRD